MADQKPLVIAPDPTAADGSVTVQRLQSGDDLDIPLADRVASLEERLASLLTYLMANGIEIPLELIV